jgi:hypothetical protein
MDNKNRKSVVLKNQLILNQKINGRRETRQTKPATAICFQHRSKDAEQLGG